MLQQGIGGGSRPVHEHWFIMSMDPQRSSNHPIGLVDGRGDLGDGGDPVGHPDDVREGASHVDADRHEAIMVASLASRCFHRPRRVETGTDSMTIEIDRTPNPNALKFSVGAPVGGPTTFTEANCSDDPLAKEILAIPGVVSMFLTADFVTLTKSGDFDWESIQPAAITALENHFG